VSREPTRLRRETKVVDYAVGALLGAGFVGAVLLILLVVALVTDVTVREAVCAVAWR
jgi:hypothetical protein